MSGETKIKPWNTEIWTDSMETLRTMNPVVPGHTVEVAGYYYGSKHGGGKFVYDKDDTTSPDDGGYCIVTASGKRFKRADPMHTLDITHFGANNDGINDDMEACVRMHNWSRSVDATFNLGIKLPAGPTALSAHDFGSTEIPSFKLSGFPTAYGRLPSSRIILIASSDTGYTFKFKARRMEVSNLAIVNPMNSTRGFVENTVTRGDYCRISVVQARDLIGRCFHVYDTIDTKLDQFYSSRGKAAFFRTDWSNESPGAWDHPTAIELSNGNIEAHTGEYAVSCIRAGQSEMNNVWFDRNERGFDISQGGWVLKNVTQENSQIASAFQYSKVTRIQCRFAQGATFDYNLSGYDPAQDPSGKPPSWVTNAMDQGRLDIGYDGITHQNGLAVGFHYPYPDMRYLNSNGQEKWIRVGQVTQNNTLGATFELEIQGANGYDNIGSSTTHPGATGFGGGRALIRGQLKYNQASTDGLQLSWHGEGATPIKEVRYVHAWQNFDIYVRVGAYARVFGAFLRSDGVGRKASGQPFFFRFGSDEAIDIGAVANLKTARRIWSVNGGTAGAGQLNTGFGMDLDAGRLIMATPTASQAASEWLPFYNNYETRFIKMQSRNFSDRLPRYNKSELPKANDEPYGQVLCMDAVQGNGVTQMRILVSDGLNWYTADGSVNIGTGSVSYETPRA